MTHNKIIISRQAFSKKFIMLPWRNVNHNIYSKYITSSSTNSVIYRHQANQTLPLKRIIDSEAHISICMLIKTVCFHTQLG